MGALDLDDVPRCRVCGCTEEHGCQGGCWWVEDPEGGDLCSACSDNLYGDGWPTSTIQQDIDEARAELAAVEAAGDLVGAVLNAGRVLACHLEAVVADCGNCRGIGQVEGEDCPDCASERKALWDWGGVCMMLDQGRAHPADPDTSAGATDCAPPQAESAESGPLAHTCGGGDDPTDCDACGARDCPWGEPMHYHHDGCPSCDVGGGAEPTTFPQAMAEVKRLNVEISEIEENYDARGTQIQDFVSAWGCSADFVDEMLNDSNVGLGEAIGWAREALASALGLPDRGGDLHALAVRAAAEIERLKKQLADAQKAPAPASVAAYPVEVYLGKPYPICPRCSRLWEACSCNPVAEETAPEQRKGTVEVVTRDPPLICYDCCSAWPELTPGTETTVTCACGKTFGARSRRTTPPPPQAQAFTPTISDEELDRR